jgi:hypothetical protein
MENRDELSTTNVLPSIQQGAEVQHGMWKIHGTALSGMRINKARR